MNRRRGRRRGRLPPLRPATRRPMARRCRPRIGAPSPTSWPAGPKPSADTSERCTACGAEVHRCHSCRNRSCPKCHGEQTRAWLDKRQAEMLACPYFHVTVTVPEELRAALRRHQRDGYGALMKAAAEAIVELARDPRHVGGTVGVLAVLHTWTQQLHLPPACPLPGHRRRPGRGRRHLASGPPRLSGAARRWPARCAVGSGPCSRSAAPG